MVKFVRRHCAFAVFWLLAATCMGQQVVRPPEPDITIVGGVAQVTMKSAGRIPVIEATVDGQGPYEFAIDSAAGLSVVDSSLLEMLHLETLGEGRPNAQGRRSQIVQWNELRIGEASFRGGAAAAGEFRDVFADDAAPPVGVLGLGLFRKLLVTLDYPAQTLRLEGGELPEPDGKQIFACDFKQGGPLLRVEIGGVKVDVLVDTAAATCLALPESLAGKIRLHGEPRAVGMAKRQATELVIAEALVEGDLAIGEHRIRKPRATFIGNQAIMGHDVLVNFAVTFDAQNGRIRLTRPEPGPIELPRRGRAGFAVRFDEGQWTVRYVLPGSPAEAAGLKAGEAIRAINGRPCAEYARGELRTLLATPGPLKVETARGALRFAVEPLD